MRAIYLIVAIALLIAIACCFIPPAHTAAAYLEVRLDRPPGCTIGWHVDTETLRGHVERHVERIKSEVVLACAVADSNVRQTAWYQKSPATAAARLTEILRVTHVRETSLILVAVTTTDPATSAALATAVGEAYEFEWEEIIAPGLDAELADLRGQKEDMEGEISKLSKAARSDGGNQGQRAGTTDRLAALSDELSRVSQAIEHTTLVRGPGLSVYLRQAAEVPPPNGIRLELVRVT